MLDKLTIEDIANEEQRLLAQTIGIDAYIELVKVFGGTSIYIFKKDSLIKEIRNKEIKSKFNGHNYFELAKQYNLTEQSIRDIISDKRQLSGQIKFEL